MLLSQVTVGTTDVAALERFHREVLLLPVERVCETTIDVEVGTGTVRYEQRSGFTGAHHLAFSIAPEDFDQAHAFLADRVDLLLAGGTSVIEGPQGWDSRSVYFTAPEGLILEYIAHEDDRGRSGNSALPAPLGIAEVGIGVADVPATIGELSKLGLAPFPPQEPAFAPVGDIDGLLIIVDRNRRWFPELRHHAATDTSTIAITAPGAAKGTIRLENAELIIN